MNIRKKQARRRNFELLENRHLLTGFTAYSALYNGPDSHPNVTRYGDRAETDSAGPLIDIESGLETDARVSVSSVGISFGGQGTSPNPNSPAGEIFSEFIDFDGDDRRTVELSDDDSYTYTFENLDSGALYDFAGVGVRGNSNYWNRWTLVEIQGAESFDSEHVDEPGLYREGLADNQIAIWFGDNTQSDQGHIVQWTNIDPGDDGEFSVVQSQYFGPIDVPQGNDPDGNKGYGISAFRLIEQVPLGPPEIENAPATEVTATSAVLNGSITTTGGQLPTSTFYYGTTDGGTDPTAWQNSIVAPAGRNLSEVISPLQPDTTYFYRSFATHALGSDWADETSSFQTLTATAPEVSTLPASDIGGVSASLRGQIDFTGNDAPVVTIFYGTTDGGSNPDAWQASADLGVQSGAFQFAPVGLSELTDYFYTVRAQNDFGTSWGQTQQFATLEIASLVISEFVADNTALTTRLRNDSSQSFVGDNLTPDWIEIRNTEPVTAHLDGFSLTDDLSSPNQWEFPTGTSIPPNGYLVVFASGFNTSDPNLDENGYLHTNFRLNTVAGSELALVGPEGTSDFSYQDLPGQFENVSYGVTGNNDERYFAVPTPGEANSTEAPQAPTISLPSQTFTGAVEVEIVAADPSHEIYYTTNERAPTASSTLYTGPLSFTRTTNLRAISVSANGESSVIVSEAYIRLTNSVANDETHLPILIVDTFGDSISSSSFGDDFVAIIEPGTDGVSSPTDTFDLTTRAGVRIRGSSSSGFSKKQYRVEFRDESGEDRKLPVLGMPSESDWIFYGPSQFDRALISNPLMFDLSNQIGRYATRTRWVEAYFNGQYFGVYAITEVIKADDDRVDVEPLTTGVGATDVEGGFIWKNDRGSAYVDPEDLNTEQRRYVDGYIESVEDAAASSNRGDPETGFASVADVGSFIDHNILNLLPMNVDALRLSSYYYKTADGLLEAGPIWDFDRSLDSTDGRDNNPRTWFGTGDSTRYFDDNDRVMSWWPDMFRDRDFVSQYIDRWFELRNDQFSNENLIATIDKHAAELGDAADRDYARWSSSRFGDFAGEIEHLKDWLIDRVEWIDSRWMAAPETDVASNRVAVGTEVNILGSSGTVYYMLDGTDPRGTNGTVRQGALTFSDAITIEADTHLVARRFQSGFGASNGYTRTGDDWSAPLTITPIREAASAENLAITEIHFNPQDANVLGGEENSDNDEFEFIELTNISSAPIELEGIQFIEVEIGGDTQGIRFTFDAQTLDAGESLVVVENVDAFQSRYGTTPRIASGVDELGDVSGQFGNKLSNGGERITLIDAQSQPIRQVIYNDDWYSSIDGDGNSLVVRNPTTSNIEILSQRASWLPSENVNGDPGVFETSVSTPGDFNGSGSVNVDDIDLLYAAIQQNDPSSVFDLNDDDQTDGDDVTVLVETILGTRRGDTNLDGRVDFQDFLILSTNFGQTSGWSGGDFDADGTVAFADFLLLSTSFGFDAENEDG